MVIPIDVWTEILLRLPAENLIQLKRVCKSWRELIEDTYFVEAHRNLHRPRFNGIVLQKYNYFNPPLNQLYYLSSESNGREEVRLRPISLPQFVQEQEWRVFDSYDGLLLIGIGNHVQHFVLYNFITRSFECLPPHGHHLGSFWDWKIVHNASTNRYTVFGLDTDFGLCAAASPKCLVLDSSSSWKELPRPQVCNSLLSTRPKGARNNGRFYWLIDGSMDLNPTLFNIILLSFDLTKEKFEYRACSAYNSRDVVRLSMEEAEMLFVSNATFYSMHHRSPDETELRVLKDLDTQPRWFTVQVIKGEPAVSLKEYSRDFGNNQLLGFLGTKLIMILQKEHEIIVYDISSEKFMSSLYTTNEDDEGPYWDQVDDWEYYYAADHVNSLISLNGMAS